MLRVSSIPHQFYLGDKPGTLQYQKDANEIVSAVSTFDTTFDNDCYYDYKICEHTLETIKKVIPKTSTAKKCEWKIILIMRWELEDGTVWLKSALQNKTNGKIALMTSTNKKEKLNRPINSLHPYWHIGHYRMSAPIHFWKELSNRILYSL